MKTITIPVASLQENCYIYFDETTKEGVLIDPGASDQAIDHAVSENNIRLLAILLTHGHFDHICGVEYYKSKYEIPVLCHEDETLVLQNAEINASAYYQRKPIEITPDRLLSDGESIDFGSFSITAIHTPGHTLGGVCFYNEMDSMLFSGDTLFKSSIGRSDFSTGNAAQLLDSIQKKLLTLPENTAVYPGHGDQTTILHEKKHNPFVGK